MMTSSFLKNFHFILMLCSFGETYTLSDHQLEQICSHIDPMVLSSLSQDNLVKLIRSEMKHTSHQKAFRNADGDGTENIDLSNDDEIDENGQLFEVLGVGSGSSTIQMSSPFLVIQANNKGRSSYVKQLQANVALVVDLSKRNDSKADSTRYGKELIQKPASTRSCKDLIRVVYRNPSTPSSREIERNIIYDEPDDRLNQLRSTVDGDRTSLSLNSEIKSDGLADYIINVSKDRATSTFLEQNTEDQIHNNYKKSDIHLIDLALALNEG